MAVEISAKALICIVLLHFVAFSKALQDSEGSIESRGKKKKLALLFHVAELVIKKFFIVKVFYTVVFLFVLHKAGYFIKWIVSYLKHHDYHEVEYYHHPHHKEYGPPGPSYGTPGSSYGTPGSSYGVSESSYGSQDSSYYPYRRYNPRGLN